MEDVVVIARQKWLENLTGSYKYKIVAIVQKYFQVIFVDPFNLKSNLFCLKPKFVFEVKWGFKCEKYEVEINKLHNHRENQVCG